MRKLLLFSIFAFIICQSCKQTDNNTSTEVASSAQNIQKETVTPGFIHAVYFWLKKDNPTLLDEFINEALPTLAKVPSIQSVTWGPPAGTPREVVDNSYDIAWIVNFENAEEQDKYQVDPIHLEFVEKYKSLFERVQVYDNIVSSK